MRPLESITGRLQRVASEELNLSGVHLRSANSFGFVIGEALVVLEVLPPGKNLGLADSDVARLRYLLEGALTDNDRLLARRAVKAMISTFVGFIESKEFRLHPEPLRVTSFSELEALLKGSRLPERVWFSPGLITSPARLLSFARRFWSRGADALMWTAFENAPLCLNPVQRPGVPEEYVVESGSSRAQNGCRSCAVATRCVGGTRGFDHFDVDLRPLKNLDSIAGTRRFIEVFCEQWGVPTSSVAIRFLDGLLLGRFESPGVVYPPLECSLKIGGGRLLPRLRLVEYAPAVQGAKSLRSTLNRRRIRELYRLCCEMQGDESSEKVSTWLQEIGKIQGEGFELSIGIDLDVLTGRLVIQLYAHLEPGEREGVLRTVEWALRREEITPGFEARLVDFCKVGLEGWGPVDVPLLALSISDREPPRSKLYFALPLATEAPNLGLKSIQVPGFEKQLPKSGLAIFEFSDGAGEWVKWDWPCSSHYQDIENVVSNLIDGAVANEGPRLEVLFRNEHFGAWPTWMSSSSTGVTFYFQPCENLSFVLCPYYWWLGAGVVGAPVIFCISFWGGVRFCSSSLITRCWHCFVRSPTRPWRTRYWTFRGIAHLFSG